MIADLKPYPDYKGAGAAWIGMDRGEQPVKAEGKPSMVEKAPIQVSLVPIQVSTAPIQVEDLPESIQQQIKGLGAKAQPEKVRSALLTICAWKAFSASDLARLLSRSRVYLLNEHLRPLVAEGKLEMTIPNQPKHPDQAYQTTPRELNHDR